MDHYEQSLANCFEYCQTIVIKIYLLSLITVISQCFFIYLDVFDFSPTEYSEMKAGSFNIVAFEISLMNSYEMVMK